MEALASSATWRAVVLKLLVAICYVANEGEDTLAAGLQLGDTDGSVYKRSVDPNFGPWTTWSACSAGVQTRTRTCRIPCKPADIDSRQCGSTTPAIGHATSPFSSSLPTVQQSTPHPTISSNTQPPTAVTTVSRSSSSSSSVSKTTTAQVGTVSPSASPMYSQWSPWTDCHRGQQTRQRKCLSKKCAAGKLADSRLCPSTAMTGVPVTSTSASQPSHGPKTLPPKVTGKPVPTPTSAAPPATTAPHGPTVAGATAAPTTSRNNRVPTKPITIVSDEQPKPSSKRPAPTRRPITINPVTTDANSSTSKSGQPVTNAPRTYHKYHTPRPQTPAATTIISRTDNYNLRITVAISSALVGSLLLVAVVACWRRLHLEQVEQRRQMMQPEATTPEYHGLQTCQQATFPAPPPTYHDSFQINAQRMQSGAAAANGSSAGTAGGRSRSAPVLAGADITSGLSQPPPSLVTVSQTRPAGVTPPPATQPPPPPPPPQPPSAGPSSAGVSSGIRTRPSYSVAARQKSHNAYIVSHLAQDMVDDELLDDEEEETCIDTETLLR